ncbi:hypothetical protein QUA41_31060 [Microcoleus sp. Pol11C1]|uniref:hypothetical protein n=1 Tax=unclassified Microcoleus TaxID=2642155 RepID=UPI002FD35D8F
MIATEILLESKTARDGQLTKVSHESAADTLSKAKALVFALWQGTGAATTEQMAEYYEVPADTLRKVLKRHRDELDSDGVKVLRGKALDEVRDIMSFTPTTGNVTIWTPRAALRLGMLLRDSQVAKQVRTVLLDVAEKAPESETQTESENIRELKLKIELAKLENRRRELDLCLVYRQPDSEQYRRGKPGKLKTLTPELIQKILVFAERKGGTITNRQAQVSCFNSAKRPDAPTVKAWFRELETLGYGKTATVGKSVCFTLHPQLAIVH